MNFLSVILYVADIQYSFVYFTVETKAYNVIISHTVQLRLLFKMLFLFVRIMLLSKYIVIENVGTLL